jgi:hypothetical protein
MPWHPQAPHLVENDVMTAARIASATGIAALVLLAGCERPATTTAVAVATPVSASAPAAAADDDGLVLADRAPRKRGGGAFGVGIRPTGSTANGITP